MKNILVPFDIFLFVLELKMEVTLYCRPHVACSSGQIEQSSTKQIITSIVDTSPVCSSYYDKAKLPCNP